MYLTLIDFPKEKKNEVNIICSEIASGDVSFVYEIEDVSEAVCRLKVKSESKDKAHKRKVWLLYKVEPLADFLSFKVIWVAE